MLPYLSRLVQAEHLEDYSYLCSRRSDARLLLLTPGAPLLPCGDAPLLFLSPEGLFLEKSLGPQNIRGQQGDKREKVKKLKCLFTISYRLSLFPASGNNSGQKLSIISSLLRLFEEFRSNKRIGVNEFQGFDHIGRAFLVFAEVCGLEMSLVSLPVGIDLKDVNLAGIGFTIIFATMRVIPAQ